MDEKALSMEASAIPSLSEPYRYLEDNFVPRKYSGRIMLFWPTDDVESLHDAASRWSKVARHVEHHVLPGDHHTCLTKYAPVLAQELQACLSKARHSLNGAK